MMARKKRTDYCGAIHHLITRGINRESIFLDMDDYNQLVTRLSKCLSNMDASCYAWALMPNHFHLLVERKEMPIKDLMQPLLTGYAMYFNKKYNRVGHVFQNRYKSKICHNTEYFMQLVSYINRNPLSGKIVNTLSELEEYPYCSHRNMLGSHVDDWVNVKYSLGLFDLDEEIARQKYLNLLMLHHDKYIGLGLMSPADRDWNSKFPFLYPDIFLSEIDVDEEDDDKTLDEIVNYVCDVYKVKKPLVLFPSRVKKIYEARLYIIYLAYVIGQYSRMEVAKKLSITPQAVSKSARLAASIFTMH